MQNVLTVCKALEKHLNHYPKDGQAQHLLGNAYSTKGESKKALKALKLAVTLAPFQAEYHYDLANIYQISGNTECACAHYQAATSLNPRFAKAYVKLGIIHTQRGEHVPAKRNLVCADKILDRNSLTKTRAV